MAVQSRHVHHTRTLDTRKAAPALMSPAARTNGWRLAEPSAAPATGSATPSAAPTGTRASPGVADRQPDSTGAELTVVAQDTACRTGSRTSASATRSSAPVMTHATINACDTDTRSWSDASPNVAVGHRTLSCIHCALTTTRATIQAAGHVSGYIPQPQKLTSLQYLERRRHGQSICRIWQRDPLWRQW